MTVEGGGRREYRNRSIRLDPELHRQLAIAAAERVVSVNWLIERLLMEGIERLAPVENFRITTEPDPSDTGETP